jgi:hypothetical protein
MKVMIVLMTLLLGACSTASMQEMFEAKPEYSTTYVYTDPDTQQGKTSAMQCQMTQAQCEQMLEMKAESCVAKKDREKAACEAKGGFCIDKTKECKADTASCTEKYNRCFQMAGGKFQLETKCVANCEKIKK